MPKIKMKMGTREIEDDQGTPISISNKKSFNDEDEDYGPSVSHSKGKKKGKKNRSDQSNEDKSPKKSDLNPVPAQEQGEVKSDEKKKKKQKERDKVEEKEENDACYLPGQKHDWPHERDPLMIFFEVLYQQLPDCELAATWMMEWGLLRPEEAMKVYERQLKNQQQELGYPADAVSLKTTSKILSRKEEERVSSNAGAKSKK